MAGNKNLRKAKNDKNDEFYTRLEDISEELHHYKDHFKDKVVFCNCDDPVESKFWFYFHKRFNSLGLKKLISTHYNKGEKSYKLEYTGGNDDNIYAGIKTDLEGDGDFRSEECIELLEESDIVVSNPPFSLFRCYLAQLMEYNKEFLIIGNKNALTYKEIFPLLKENKVWLGNNSPKDFYTADGVLSGKLQGLTRWFTNLDYMKRHYPLDLVFFYEDDQKKYPKYDNYDAIEISRVVNIPADYKGVMGVPITFLDKNCPEQFEILGMCSSAGYNSEIVGIDLLKEGDARPLIQGKNTYARIFIKNRNARTKNEVLGL